MILDLFLREIEMTSAVTVSRLFVFSRTYKSTDGTASPWKYAGGRIGRDAYGVESPGFLRREGVLETLLDEYRLAMELCWKLSQ